VVGIDEDAELLGVAASLLVVSSLSVLDPEVAVLVTCADDEDDPRTGSWPALTRNTRRARTDRKMARLTPVTRSQEGLRFVLMTHTIGTPPAGALGAS
jgi:hypothetical protein